MKAAVIVIWVSMILLIVTVIAWQMFEHDASPLNAERSMWAEAGIDQDYAMGLVRVIVKTIIIISIVALTTSGVCIILVKQKG